MCIVHRAILLVDFKGITEAHPALSSSFCCCVSSHFVGRLSFSLALKKIQRCDSGIGLIVRGAVGGVGCAVLMPAVRAAEGHQEMGMMGVVLGGAG